MRLDGLCWSSRETVVIRRKGLGLQWKVIGNVAAALVRKAKLD